MSFGNLELWLLTFVVKEWEDFHHNTASVMPILQFSQTRALVYLGYKYLKFCSCKLLVFRSHNLVFGILRLRQSFDRTTVIFKKQSNNRDHICINYNINDDPLFDSFNYSLWHFPVLSNIKAVGDCKNCVKVCVKKYTFKLLFYWLFMV